MKDVKKLKLLKELYPDMKGLQAGDADVMKALFMFSSLPYKQKCLNLSNALYLKDIVMKDKE